MRGMSDPAVTRFLRDAAQYPMLTQERERQLASAWCRHQDRTALEELVGSHVRLVVKTARGFAGYGLPIADLVSEGNVGLMQAAQKFDPDRGFRFATCAMWWIRAAIQEYVLYSWSLVKIGTTEAQKKLFFNLGRLKAQLQQFEQTDLVPEVVTAIAADLDVPEAEVVAMNRRLSGPDDSLNVMLAADVDSEWLALLTDERPNQEATVADLEEERRHRMLLSNALKMLNRRERDIVIERHLKEEPTSFEQLSRRYAVSRERVRQIEVRAISKLAATVRSSSCARPQAEIYAS